MSSASVNHNWFDSQPVVARKPVAWPGGASLALGVVVSVEQYEMAQKPGAAMPLTLPGGMGRGPYPDFRTYSLREYGNRVGIFRLMQTLDKHGIRATVAIDAQVARGKPVIVGECVKRGWEIAAHGNAVTQLISAKLSESEEREQISAALSVIEKACGKRPSGWHGPEYGESARTPDILAESGVRYVLDWPNDELPYAMRTRNGSLVSLPMLVDFDDVFAHWYRKLSMARWQLSIADALDWMCADGEKQPRMLILNLHPWLIGQPWRISYLDAVLTDLKRRKGIWVATAGEIVECWKGQQSA